ncbi:hypothetical protein D3C75_657700 [compost metagenome]
MTNAWPGAAAARSAWMRAAWWPRWRPDEPHAAVPPVRPGPAPVVARHSRQRSARAVLRPAGGGRGQHCHRLFRCPSQRRHATARQRVPRCRPGAAGQCPGPRPADRSRQGAWLAPRPGGRVHQRGRRRQRHPAVQRQGCRWRLPVARASAQCRGALCRRNPGRRPGTWRSMGRTTLAGGTGAEGWRQHRRGHEDAAHEPRTDLRTGPRQQLLQPYPTGNDEPGRPASHRRDPAGQPGHLP